MSVTVNMERARAIWRNKIRKIRAEKFKQLDVQYQIADENNDPEEKAAVVAKKKTLRDAPADPAIEAATTTQDLKKFWPFE